MSDPIPTASEGPAEPVDDRSLYQQWLDGLVDLSDLPADDQQAAREFLRGEA